ncbi:MAG TPA: S4 domain-containing protein, partial [Ramlibacter sp.]|nr:S4 domain-containing protein [Ramlibacter sp.]
MAEPVRLAKRVAAMVPCSRREAEQYIEGGFVRVDGQVVDQPQARVADAQVVALDATASLDALEPVTLLLHKPANLSYEQAPRLLVADKHAADDASGIRVVRKHFTQLTPLMPMLEEASGLAVFSQDFR